MGPLILAGFAIALVVVVVVIYQFSGRNGSAVAAGDAASAAVAAAPAGATTITVTPPAPSAPTYTFYQGKDSGGGDIQQVANLADNVAGLKAWCDARSDCKGFNTNGWMKSTIAPSSQWGTWTSDATKGLYVRA